MQYLNQKLKAPTLLFLAFALLLLAVYIPPANAAAAAAPSIAFDNKGIVTLHSATLADHENGQIATMTIKIQNTSNSDIKLIDYWAKIVTTSGKKFKSYPKETDKTKNIVRSKGSTYLTYYAYVDTSVKRSDLAIEFLKWDFSKVSSNYEVVLGKLPVHTTTKGLASNSKAGTILFNESELNVSVKSYNFNKDASRQYLTLDLELNNLSQASIDITKLQFFLQTTNGGSYKNVTFADATTTIISPKAKKLVSLSYAIPNESKVKPESLIIGFEEETSKVMLPVGLIELKSLAYTPALKVDKAGSLYMNGKKISVSISKSGVLQTDDGQTLSSTITFINQENSPVTVANILFYYKSVNGNLYPLTMEETDLKLLPQIKKSVKIKGIVPDSIDLKKGSVIMVSQKADSDEKATLVSFEVNTSEDTSTTTVEKISYEGYEIKLDAVYRTPQEETDMLVAYFTLTNTTSKALTKPKLQSEFIIDGNFTSNEKTAVVELDKITTVPAKSSYTVISYFEVPYVQTFSELEVKLTDASDAESLVTIGNFGKKDLQQAELNKKDQAIKINEKGKKSEMKLLNASVYKSGSDSTNLFYAEIEITNKERRINAPLQLTGYVENRDGGIIPVTFTATTKRLLSNSKIVMSGLAQLPAEFEDRELKFYFGESLNLGEDKPQILLKPVYQKVSALASGSKIDDLKGIVYKNYTLDLSYLRADLFVNDSYVTGGISLSFQYSLTKTSDNANYADAQDLYIEVVDHSAGKKKYQYKLTTDNTNGDAELVEGTQLTKYVRFEDPSFANKFEFKGLTVNIYKQVQEQKVMLASKDLFYFVTQP
ncbi:hypothetical protein D3P08_18485 [Paenibacillus nanensis]|uniref:DUF4352 domain-containing protein n=1 Tax=Paenibacillus nanensis TaxID=393251 RepID=A0A3A1UTD8_9BACL|nr:hypothetical protein [Paenibacillus nanensis]RIX51066.1 hypothetical protein D3P08_18485 [Paenibacillus nanensis]